MVEVGRIELLPHINIVQETASRINAKTYVPLGVEGARTRFHDCPDFKGKALAEFLCFLPASS